MQKSKINTKKVIATLFVACALIIISCKKGDTGPAGDKGATGNTGATGQPGPQAKTFVFNLTFNAGDTFKSYAGVTGFNTDDVLLVYIFNANYGSDYYVQLPYMIGGAGAAGVHCYAEFSETSGNLFINTEWADGTAGSPYTSSVTFKFKAVLISSSQFKAHPNTNWKNYAEVKSVLNLKD